MTWCETSSWLVYEIYRWRNDYWGKRSLHWKKRFLWQECPKPQKNRLKWWAQRSKHWKSNCEWNSSWRRQRGKKSSVSTETRFGLTKRKVHVLWFFSLVGILPCFGRNVWLLPDARSFCERLPEKTVGFWRENGTRSRWIGGQRQRSRFSDLFSGVQKWMPFSRRLASLAQDCWYKCEF